MAGTSIGDKVRRSRISALMPSASSDSAACSTVCIIDPQAITVTSVPARTRRASPMGTV